MWEDAAVCCSRLAMSLDTSITRRYLGSVSMLTVSPVMYVNYRIRGEFILISISLSILEGEERWRRIEEMFIRVKSFRYTENIFQHFRCNLYESSLFSFFFLGRGRRKRGIWFCKYSPPPLISSSTDFCPDELTRWRNFSPFRRSLLNSGRWMGMQSNFLIVMRKMNITW